MTVEVPCPGAGHSYLVIIPHKHLFHKGIFQKNNPKNFIDKLLLSYYTASYITPVI